MDSGSYQSALDINFLESMMINYVDMDLAEKDKPLLMETIFLNVIGAVNLTTTGTLKDDLESKINSSIKNHIII
jgi:hypothetical protein